MSLHESAEMYLETIYELSQKQNTVRSIDVAETSKAVIIDIADTGKGIAKSKRKAVFLPGYTTKTRGWGLGLSLAKRIVEKYHKGKIFIKKSEVGVGTTFRIVLKK